MDLRLDQLVVWSAAGAVVVVLWSGGGDVMCWHYIKAFLKKIIYQIAQNL
jgi:hypothetical protein